MGKIKYKFLKKLCALSILIPLCACFDLDDKREDNEIYKLYSKMKGKFDVKISELFLGDWEFVCVIPPGSDPSIWLRHLLPQNSDKYINIVDPDDFPDYLWKFILIDRSRDNIRLLQLDKRDFTFKIEIFCTGAKDKTIYFTEGKDDSYGKERPNFLVEVR